jgi:hypothetical protein
MRGRAVSVLSFGGRRQLAAATIQTGATGVSGRLLTVAREAAARMPSLQTHPPAG